MKRRYKILIIGVIALLLIWFIPIPGFLAFKIALGNSVKGSAVSITGHKPLQYRQFELLKSVSSTNALIRLYRNHPNASVKCYSFWALTERQDGINHFELLKHGITDTRKVKTMFGCFISSTTVADFLISTSYEVISRKDSITLDSLILYSDLDLRSKNTLLRTLEPDEKDYNRILELANNGLTPEAIITLAKYQNKENISFIKEELADINKDPYYSLLAIKYFPDSYFIPELINAQKRLLDKSNGVNHIAIRALYKSLVRYDNKQIKQILEKIVEIDNDIQKIKSLPDSIKAISKFEKHHFNLENDSIYFVFDHDYDMNDDYTIHVHVEYLKLALLDFPNSTFKYLEEKIKLEDFEIDMINDELKMVDYE